jgi:hypothetical protein
MLALMTGAMIVAAWASPSLLTNVIVAAAMVTGVVTAAAARPSPMSTIASELGTVVLALATIAVAGAEVAHARTLAGLSAALRVYAPATVAGVHVAARTVTSPAAPRRASVMLHVGAVVRAAVVRAAAAAATATATRVAGPIAGSGVPGAGTYRSIKIPARRQVADLSVVLRITTAASRENACLAAALCYTTATSRESAGLAAALHATTYAWSVTGTGGCCTCAASPKTV